MPTPAAGSELRTAVTKTPENSPVELSADAGDGSLSNASGTARRLRASPLFAIGPGDARAVAAPRCPASRSRSASR